MLGDVTAKILSTLDKDRSLVGVYTNIEHRRHTGELLYTTRHTPWNMRKQVLSPFVEVLHLHVFRRNLAMQCIEQMLEWDTGEEGFLMTSLCRFGNWFLLPDVAYAKYDNAKGAAMRLTSGQCKRLVAYAEKVQAQRADRGMC